MTVMSYARVAPDCVCQQGHGEAEQSCSAKLQRQQQRCGTGLALTSVGLMAQERTVVALMYVSTLSPTTTAPPPLPGTGISMLLPAGRVRECGAEGTQAQEDQGMAVSVSVRYS